MSSRHKQSRIRSPTPPFDKIMCTRAPQDNCLKSDTTSAQHFVAQLWSKPSTGVQNTCWQSPILENHRQVELSVFLFCLNRQCFFCQDTVLRFRHKSHMVRIRKTSGHHVLCRGLKTSSGFTHKHVGNKDSNCVYQLVGLAACSSTTNTSWYVSQVMNMQREHDVLYECQPATVRSICGLQDQISHI